jgi:hypothetical protein
MDDIETRKWVLGVSGWVVLLGVVVGWVLSSKRRPTDGRSASISSGCRQV